MDIPLPKSAVGVVRRLEAADRALILADDPASKPTDEQVDRWFRQVRVRASADLRGLVADGCADDEIAARLEMDVRYVAAYIVKAGLRSSSSTTSGGADNSREAKLRRAQRERWNEAIAAKAQATSLGALGLVGDCIDEGNTKELANAARAAQSLVQIARQADKMDEAAAANAAPAISLSLFYFQLPGSSPRERDAQPIDVASRPA